MCHRIPAIGIKREQLIDFEKKYIENKNNIDSTPCIDISIFKFKT